jgi:hypothetical protein
MNVYMENIWLEQRSDVVEGCFIEPVADGDAGDVGGMSEGGSMVLRESAD